MVKEQLGRVGEPLLSTTAIAKRDYESEKRREVEELRRFREEMVRSVDQQREDARREFENEASVMPNCKISLVFARSMDFFDALTLHSNCGGYVVSHLKHTHTCGNMLESR